jgi:hypothetical protein
MTFSETGEKINDPREKETYSMSRVRSGKTAVVDKNSLTSRGLLTPKKNILEIFDPPSFQIILEKTWRNNVCISFKLRL